MFITDEQSPKSQVPSPKPQIPSPKFKVKSPKLERRGSFPGDRTKLPKAFTEKGLYMLATILKSPVATQTTLAIIETFSKIRESGRYVQLLLNEKDEDAKKPLFPKNRKPTEPR